ncbi:uncharacterized protein LOC136080409 [Hydra vulgaris]|uniref:Uncharacterized protein LOC136080409 n=1 Tax=Hydra vulgaris TaxID=6087 RepID=A0ABM4BV83_HYDVU
MSASEVLNFTEIPTVDAGVERFEFHEYDPVARTNLNSVGKISINIEQQDLFTLPSEAFLLFEERLLKADGTSYANAHAVSLTNNGIMHLFSQILYQLSNQEVEAVYHLGQATTMLGMLKYPNNFQLAQGLNQLWYENSATTAALAGNSGFAHIFGFCDDYDKVIYGFKHTLTLVRKSDDDTIFRLPAAAAGKVNLDKMLLFIPNVIPSDIEKINFYKTIESKVTLLVSFHARQCDTISEPQSTRFSWILSVKTSPEKPRKIIVGFQTNKDGNQELNPLIFGHCDLKNMYTMLNEERYPAVDYNLSFPNHQFSRAYRDASLFSEKFYGTNELILQSNIATFDYKYLCPLMVFNVSIRSERLQSSVVYVQIKAIFNAVIPADTEAFAVVISDRLLQFQSDRNKMNIVN